MDAVRTDRATVSKTARDLMGEDEVGPGGYRAGCAERKGRKLFDGQLVSGLRVPCIEVSNDVRAGIEGHAPG